MTRLEARREELKSRQHRRRTMAVEIGEATDRDAWAKHLTVFCRLGRKRAAVERKLTLRGEGVDES